MSQTLLSERNYTIILARGTNGSPVPLPDLINQWRIAEQSLLKIAQQCERFAPEQLTIYLASEPLQKYNQANSATLAQIIQEGYALEKVYIYRALEMALAEHFQKKARGEMKKNGEIILVILDSEPSPRRPLIKLLVEAAQNIDSPQEIGILFAQVGDNLMAKGFLQALDDDLHRAGAKKDIVDTKALAQMTPEQTIDFLLGALLD